MDRRQLLKTTIAATAAAAVPFQAAQPAEVIATAIPKPIDIRPYANYVFEWFVSHDGETYYEGFSTKEEAIEYANASEMSIVAECKSTDFNIEIDGRDIIERINDNNYEGEGDGIRCTREQENDLTRMLTRAMEAWVVKHNIDIRAWSFAEVRNKTELTS